MVGHGNNSKDLQTTNSEGECPPMPLAFNLEGYGRH